MKLLLIITTLLFSPHTSNQLSSVVATVVSIEKRSKTVTIKNDQNVSVLIQASNTTVCLRIPAGAQSLEQATPIQFDEITAGDRVLSRGTKNENTFPRCESSFFRKTTSPSAAKKISSSGAHVAWQAS